MSVRPSAAAPSIHAQLRTQREHELNQALEAARSLQARLELLGDHADDVRRIHQLRDRLAGEVHGLLDGLPCQSNTASRSTGDESSSFSLDRADGDALTRQALMLEDELVETDDGR